MFQDDERALTVERTAVASVRVDLINLALWSDWMNKQGAPPKSVNQAVGSALNYIVDLLRSNGQITESITLNQAAVMLDNNRLLQKRMYGRKGSKLGTFMSFENMRMEGDDPRRSDRFNIRAYDTLHGNDERTTMPLQVLGNEGMRVEGAKARASINEKIEALTPEDVERLKEIWSEMTEEERFVVQKKVYRNNAGGEYLRRCAILEFYPRFRPIPEDRLNVPDEIIHSDEYQEWARGWASKQDAFVKAMTGMIPELVSNKERLELGEEIEGGERPIINVPTLGLAVVTQEEYEAHIKQEEENRKQAMKEKEKEKLLKKEAEKEARKELGMTEVVEEDKDKKGNEDIDSDEKFLIEINKLGE